MIKKWTSVFLLLLSRLYAEPGNESIFYAENTPPPFCPFAISGSYLDVSKAHFRTPGFENETIHYRQWEAALAYTHPFSPTWGLIFGAGWVGTEVHMTNNPEFNETIFNYVNLSFGAFTKAYPDWTWTLTISAFLDTEVFSLIDYTLYQGVLWGKYNLCKDLELDFGIIAEVGLKKEKVWPILGFVYSPYNCLRLYVVYPINISLEYDFSKCVSFAGSIRFLRNRHRLGQEEIEPQGIFEYRNTGAEFDLIVRPFRGTTVKGFVGSALGGDFKVTDRNDKNATHYKFKGSFYWGASAVVSF